MSESLIDTNAIQTEQGAVDAGTTYEAIESQSEPSLWYFADGVPGAGEKPDYLLPKFKSIAEQAKSYVEAEKRLGGFKGAPENYELNLPEEITSQVNIDADSPLLKAFTEKAKAMNMSQEAYTELAGLYIGNIAEQSKINREKELQELGDDAGQRIQRITQWASNNFDKDEFDVIRGLATTASTIKILEKIRSKMTSTKIPTDINKESPAIPYETRQLQLTQMVGDKRYKEDPSYRAMVDAEFEKFYANN